MPRLSGRTFSDVISKGDYDPAARAELTLEDFTTALIRWAVDIYHNQPHEGLGGETPIACWRRLAQTGGGVRPSPDLDTRLAVFGTPVERVVHPDGITVLGITYQSWGLQQWAVRARSKRVPVRLYMPDLGKIMVRLGETWHAVPALQPFGKGLDARVWCAAVARLRTLRDRQAAQSEQVVRKAIADIEALNETAMRRVGLAVDDWSDSFIAREEERLFIGFTLPVPIETPPAPSDGFGTLLAAPFTTAADLPPPADAQAPPRLDCGGLIAMPNAFEIDERLTMLRSRYIATERNEQFLAHFNRLLRVSPEGVLTAEPTRFTSRKETRGIVIADGPGGGKTTLINRALERHPAMAAPPDSTCRPTSSSR